MHICHLITGLGAGGTPVMLEKLLARLRQSDGSHHSVISLIGEGAIGDRIIQLGVPVYSLGLRRGIPSPFGLSRLIKLLRRLRPDLLQTWLYHADLLGGLAGRWVGRFPVVWNIRHATLERTLDSRSTLWTAKLCSMLSDRFCDAIVINSESGCQVHVKAGYSEQKMVVIENGFDLDRFEPSIFARQRIRRELDLTDATPLIGLIARWSRLKGQPLFISAMNQVALQHSGVSFVLCGHGMTPENRELATLIERTTHPSRFRLLGERNDLPTVQAALDIAVSASLSEAFSNSIGEALACGVPCVTTNVGDSARLVGNAGSVVPAGDGIALARECIRILEMDADERDRLRVKARRRIEENFSIDRVAEKYLNVWKQVATDFNRTNASQRRAA